jgi:hypothetical protein
MTLLPITSRLPSGNRLRAPSNQAPEENRDHRT